MKSSAVYQSSQATVPSMGSHAKRPDHGACPGTAGCGMTSYRWSEQEIRIEHRPRRISFLGVRAQDLERFQREGCRWPSRFPAAVLA